MSRRVAVAGARWSSSRKIQPMWACQRPRSARARLADVRAVRVAVDVGVGVVLAVVGDPVVERALDRHRAGDRERALDVRACAANDRWVNRRWKPTVMPKPVTTYIAAKSARSMPSTARFQSRTIAARTPANGIMIGEEVGDLVGAGHGHGADATLRPRDSS